MLKLPSKSSKYTDHCSRWATKDQKKKKKSRLYLGKIDYLDLKHPSSSKVLVHIVENKFLNLR